MRIGQYRRQVDLPGPEGKRAVANTAPGQAVEAAGQLGMQALDTTARIGQALGQIEYQRKRQEFQEGFNQFYEEQIASNPDPGTYMELFEQYVSGTDESEGLRQTLGNEIRNPWAQQMWEQDMDQTIEQQRHKLSMTAINATQEIGFRVNKQVVDEAIKNQDWSEGYRTVEDSWETGIITEDVYHQWMLTIQREQKREAVFNDTLTILGEEGADAAFQYLQSSFDRTEGATSYRNLPPAYEELQEQIGEVGDERRQLQDKLTELSSQGAPEEEIQSVQAEIDATYEEVNEIQQQQLKMMEGTEAMELITPREREELRNRLAAYIKDQEAAEQDDPYLRQAHAYLSDLWGQGMSADRLLNHLLSDKQFDRLRNPETMAEANKYYEWVTKLRREIEGEEEASRESDTRAQNMIYGLYSTWGEMNHANPEMVRAMLNIGNPVSADNQAKEPITVEELENIMNNGLESEDGETIPTLKDGKPTEALLTYLGDNYVLDPSQHERLVNEWNAKQPEGPEAALFAYVEQNRKNGDIPNWYPNARDEEMGMALTALEIRSRLAERLKALKDAGEEYSFDEMRQMADNLMKDETPIRVEELLDDKSAIANQSVDERSWFGKMFGPNYKGSLYDFEGTERYLDRAQRGQILGRGEDYEDALTQLDGNLGLHLSTIAPSARALADMADTDAALVREQFSTYDEGTIAERMAHYDDGLPALPVGDRWVVPQYIKIGRLNFRIFLRSRTSSIDTTRFTPDNYEVAYMPDIPARVAARHGIPANTETITDPVELWQTLYDLNESKPDWEKEETVDQTRREAAERAGRNFSQ